MAKRGMVAKVKRGKSQAGKIRKVLNNPASVLVGIPSDAVPYPDGTNVTEVGIKHEFGLGVPERSFMRSTIKENRRLYKKMTEKAVLDSVHGKKPLLKSLKIIGNKSASQVKQKIVSIKTPANTLQTVQAKGSSNPLIDSGHMKNSVTYEVVEK